VDLDTELAAIVTKAPCHISAQLFLDVPKDLIVARLIAHEQETQPILLHHVTNDATR
jgi:hypothetical protein